MKKIITFIISIAMVFSAVPVSAAAQQPSQASSYGKLNKKTGVFSYKKPGLTIPKGAAAKSFPTKFDLRTDGRINPQVKDQGEKSFCWSFATMASLESNLIKNRAAGKSVDLSEAHLAYYTLHGERNDNFSKYGGRDTCYSLTGTANYYNATAGLARGYGAVNESDFPYTAYSGKKPDNKYVSNSLMVKSAYELTDSVFIYGEDPTETSYDEDAVNAVKQLIRRQGAVCTSMNFPSGNEWLLKTFGAINIKKLKAYYEKEEDVNLGSGHAITIIGWDDTYNDFPSRDVEISVRDRATGEMKKIKGNDPPGPGAWIVKDSYGSDIHGDGYFYMSYYSACLFQFVNFQGRKATKKQIYQYDGVGVGEGMLRYADKVSGANTYTARTDLLLSEVASYAPTANSKINFKIYVNQNGKSPVSGSKVYDKTFTQTYAGYKRNAMGKVVAIPKGTKFSIVVTTKANDGKYYAPFEVTNANDPGQSPAAVRPGQTYIQQSGKWKSVTRNTRLQEKFDYQGQEFIEEYQTFNALVKGFGLKGGTKAQKIKVKTSRKVKKGKSIKLKAKLTKGIGKLYYQSSDTAKATVSAKGVVKAKKKGTVKITIYATPNAKYKSAKKIVKIRIK